MRQFEISARPCAGFLFLEKFNAKINCDIIVLGLKLGILGRSYVRRFLSQIKQKKIDTLTNVDFASQGKSENSSHKLLLFLLAYFVIVLCILTFVILKIFFINELRLMDNVDLQVAEATLNQRIIMTGLTKYMPAFLRNKNDANAVLKLDAEL